MCCMSILTSQGSDIGLFPGLLIPKKIVDEDGEEKEARTVRSTVYADSDSE